MRFQNCWGPIVISKESGHRSGATVYRGVARGGPGGGQSPPEFGRSVNPIQTRGTDYAPHTTASPSGFKKLSTPLLTHCIIGIADEQI